ncbi:FtsW/RodA/SpoVE family cell cycle protein [Erysipelothrix enhydrae]|uniref:FtsW/RodA/SpoVE family cell cycle protein n=1 Tax=Erysipelothrix enhydrae TaxID=2890314 RepID=UPI002B248FB7|nr:FtsW/RodA/SpoVE family cell cycle protein [Erysipelothrix sp. 4322-04]WRB86565.1 FtsW/RodA/SpoVE family cell cycle protein [Erysipelothrix sp. 4322-04]
MKKRKISLKMPMGYNRPIHAAALILNIFGVLMVISGSMTSGSTPKSLVLVGVKELVFVIVSYIMMVMVARRFSLNYFRKNYAKILLLMVGMLGLTLVFPAINGAKAWINLKIMTIQPSEFAKIFGILTIATFLADRNKRTSASTFDMVKKPFFIIIAIFVFVVKAQHDLGSAVVIIGVAYICVLIPSHDKLTRLQKGMFILAGVGIIGLIFLDSSFGISLIEKLNIPPYMIGRFKTSSNPFLDRYGSGYQIFNGMVAMFKGGLFGMGYGNSLIKYGYLPEAHTDFILAVTIEELGMIGFSVILIGYGTMLFQLVKYSFKVKKESDKVILMGTVAYIMIHFIFNIGGITALIPLTGVPLLFISKGGSSRMAIMIAIGLTQNVISRYEMGIINVKRKDQLRIKQEETKRKENLKRLTEVV